MKVFLLNVLYVRPSSSVLRLNANPGSYPHPLGGIQQQAVDVRSPVCYSSIVVHNILCYTFVYVFTLVGEIPQRTREGGK